MNIVIKRWPVLRRLTDKAGKLSRRESTFVRTAEPLESREVEVVGISQTRVTVWWCGGPYHFSLKTWRCAHMADWVVGLESRKEVRDHRSAVLGTKRRRRKGEEIGNDAT